MAEKGREDGHAGYDDADELLGEIKQRYNHNHNGLIRIIGFDGLVPQSRDAGQNCQSAGDEDGTQFPFLFRGHVQIPDAGDGDDEDHQVAGDVDDAGANQDGVSVDALAACGHDGVFADAFGGNGDDGRDGVEDVDPETCPDGAPDGSPARAGGDKETLVEEEEGDFGETHADSGNDLGVVEMLE
ncbi:MAG: hypothetical protein Q9169_007123 [Polycauliona sp. 2 TL-2023]